MKIVQRSSTTDINHMPMSCDVCLGNADIKINRRKSSHMIRSFQKPDEKHKKRSKKIKSHDQIFLEAG